MHTKYKTLQFRQHQYWKMWQAKPILSTEFYNLTPKQRYIRHIPETTHVGFAARLKLEQFGIKSSNSKVQKSINSSIKLVISLLKKLKSPLKQTTVKSAVCANPLHILSKTKKVVLNNYLSLILQKFLRASRITSKTTELAKEQ